MKLGVMSDTHGNIETMNEVASKMLWDYGVDVVIHLGDNYADALQLTIDKQRLYMVPGMFEAAWEDRNIPHRLIKEFGDVVFMMSHTPERDSHDRIGDINPEKARSGYGVDVLLHGHTHRYVAGRRDDGLIVICPGHLKKQDDRGRRQTFAIVEVEKPKVSVKIIDLNGVVALEDEFVASRIIDDDETSKIPDEYSEI